MKNQEVAAVFERIASLLDIKGEDFFRVRAYRQAAAAIDGLTENLEEICRRGDLREIPGIGESIGKKISDIIETGTTPYYEEIKSQYPESLVDMLEIPGVGPKTVKQLFDRLGVAGIDELDRAARAHRVSEETDLGKKTEDSIIHGIETLRERGAGRLPLKPALDTARDIIELLSASPAIVRVSEAGSLRRRKDTVGDIDLVAQSSDAAKAAAVFAGLPQFQEIVETGPSMTAGLARDGRRIDLRMSPPENYGAMLHHFTGSKQHNIKLRGLARDMGLTISEYGVHRLDNDRLVTSGRTEEEIYAALGLPFIPPELREDWGEVEAAKAGKLPVLVEVKNILGDLHVHSTASDGGNSIEEMAASARVRGYNYIAICDHSRSLAIAHGLDEERLLAQIEEIKALNERLDGFHVFAGSEVDIRADGKLDMDHSILKKLDVVVASLHHRYNQDSEQLTHRAILAIETGMVDILAHPTGRILGHRDPMDLDMDRVFDAAAAHGTAMEINSHPERLDLYDIYIHTAKKRGLKLAINTDAHNTSEYSNITYGVWMARRGWLEAPDVLNAWPAGDLKAWLKRRRDR